MHMKNLRGGVPKNPTKDKFIWITNNIKGQYLIHLHSRLPLNWIGVSKIQNLTDITHLQ